MSPVILLGLVICNAIWATNPTMGKLVMLEASPLQTAWLRYGSAWIACVVMAAFSQQRRKLSSNGIKQLSPYFPWLLILGLVTFVGSSYVQYVGLAKSTATANSLIVAMEPLFASLLAWFFLRERLHWRQSIAFAFAIFGFCLLSNVRPNHLADSLSLFNTGNIFLLLSMPAEATYSIISRKLAGKLSPATIFTASLSIGFFVFSILVFFVCKQNFPPLFSYSWKTYFAILWLGPLATTFAYMYWSYALEFAPVAVVSLTLFVQPIQGTIVGTTLLGERLNIWQALGAFFILFALCFQTLPYLRKENR